MQTNIRQKRWLRPAAWVVAAVFVAGFFVPAIGDWSGPTLAAWLVGTQRPWRGFLWMLGLTTALSLLMHARGVPLSGFEAAFSFAGWLLMGCVFDVLPFTLHRLVSPRLPDGLAALPLPLTVVGMAEMTRSLPIPGRAPHSDAFLFLSFWLAAILVWMWNHDFRAARIRAMAVTAAVVFTLAAGLAFFPVSAPAARNTPAAPASTIALICWAVLAALSALSVFRLRHARPWSSRPEAVGLLRAPVTREPMRVVTEGGREFLVTCSGARFPINDGIPSFLDSQDLTGDNGKYNHLYQTIGGFYDDTQRAVCALRGLDRDAYFRDYMDLLEVSPGDSVLETSVGTGLNFKYLPAGVELSGLDLSGEMLAACQANLRRWKLEADLYLGNAERLPFADCSFDVVFHVGGISFFSNPAEAIREMIRVAKPGSFLLIEDETEDYAKSTYERMPIASGYFRDREEAIKVPIDLVPPEMEDIQLRILRDGKFFAITFRKPMAPVTERLSDCGRAAPSFQHA